MMNIDSCIFDKPIITVKEFEIYEQLAADMMHGIVMPRNQIGYDVLAENYKYQVKHSTANIKRKCWEFHFRIPINRDNHPDFCILYGETGVIGNHREFNLFCFLIPYAKILKKIIFIHGGNVEGHIVISCKNDSWIWDWYLSNTDYDSFIKRRNELNRYIQLALIS